MTRAPGRFHVASRGSNGLYTIRDRPSPSQPSPSKTCPWKSCDPNPHRLDAFGSDDRSDGGAHAWSWQRPSGRPRAGRTARSVDFSREILPIFSDNCFLCHGPDAKNPQSRPSTRPQGAGASATDPVIVPGKGDESEVILRVTSRDPDEVMPPPKSGRSLTPAQVGERLKRIGSTRGRHGGALGPRAAATVRAPGGPGARLARQSDRPVRAGPARGGGDAPLARGGASDARDGFSKTIPRVMVMEDMPTPRETFLPPGPRLLREADREGRPGRPRVPALVAARHHRGTGSA